MSDAYSQALASIDPGSIESMTPEQAGAKLAELSLAYSGAQPIADVMKLQPTTAVEAYKKLAALQENPGWVKLHAAGNPAALKDFATLTKMIADGSEADFAVAGIVPPHHYNSGPGAGLQDQISAANDMRARGLSAAGVNEWLAREGIDPSKLSNETAIHSILSDKRPSLATHEAGKVELQRIMGDKEFLDLRAAGDPWANTHWLIVHWAAGCYVPGVP